MIPRRIKIIRLFESNKIKKEIYSDKEYAWNDIKVCKPEKSTVFYIKKENSIITAIYLHSYPIPGFPKWWDVSNDEFIDEKLITHWSDIE
jgi:hypothetical protein